MPIPTYSVEGWPLVISLAIFGGIFICVALMGLGEYRKLFISRPLEAMSFEVILQLLFHPASTPALLCIFALIIGIFFLAIGVLALLAMAGIVLYGIWIQIWPKILSHLPLLGGTNVNH